MSKKLHWLLAVLLAFSLVAAACGDDDDDASESESAETEAVDEAAAGKDGRRGTLLRLAAAFCRATAWIRRCSSRQP